MTAALFFNSCDRWTGYRRACFFQFCVVTSLISINQSLLRYSFASNPTLLYKYMTVRADAAFPITSFYPISTAAWTKSASWAEKQPAAPQSFEWKKCGPKCTGSRFPYPVIRSWQRPLCTLRQDFSWTQSEVPPAVFLLRTPF